MEDVLCKKTTKTCQRPAALIFNVMNVILDLSGNCLQLSPSYKASPLPFSYLRCFMKKVQELKSTSHSRTPSRAPLFVCFQPSFLIFFTSLRGSLLLSLCTSASAMHAEPPAVLT